jgi:UDP-galactose transporter B1
LEGKGAPIKCLDFSLSNVTTFFRYKALDVVSGVLITVGIALFSYKKSKAGSSNEDVDGYLQLFGLGLVFCNLLLDGYTNAKQEKLYSSYKSASPFHMMCFLNGWTAVFISIWLGTTYVVNGETSDLASALVFFKESPEILPHILTFSLMGSVGQIFIFITMKDFGAMINTTICLTR